jgi:hypothetical protein
MPKIMLGFIVGVAVAAGLLTVKDGLGAPKAAAAPAASQPAGALAGTESPHGQALSLVLSTQQKAIRDMEKQAGSLRLVGKEDSWWFDTSRRTWTVARPFAPGMIDSTHMFTVRYAIDGNEVGAWSVDTQGLKVTPEAKAGASTAPATSQPAVAKIIEDMTSDDGNVAAAATKAVFDLGEKALAPLKEAGAKQVSPFSPSMSRLDMVYSLLDGLKPNPPGGHAGYTKNSFGLRLEAGCTLEDVKTMGQKYGFEVEGEFRADGIPNCYVTLKAGKTLADVLKAVLSGEPKVLMVNLNYFES